MKTAATPFLQVLALIIATIILGAALFGSSLIFGNNAMFVFGVLFLVIPPVVFWTGNKIIYRLEKMPLPSSSDHLRQCAILYFIFLSAVIYTIVWNNGGLDEAYISSFAPLSLLGILTNAFFLHRQRKINSISRG